MMYRLTTAGRRALLALVLALVGSLGAAGAASAAETQLTVNLPGDVEQGSPAPISATLAGEGGSPSGSVTFMVYDDGDTTCSGTPVFEQTDTEVDYEYDEYTGITTSVARTDPDFTPAAPGDYRVVVTYGGDNSFDAAGPTACDANVLTVVKPTADMSHYTDPSAIYSGQSAVSHAILSHTGTAPTGTVTFTVYGVNDSDCAGAPLFTQTKTLAPMVAPEPEYPDEEEPPPPTFYASAETDPYELTAPGTYQVTTDYSGDGTYAASGASSCGSDEVHVTLPPEATLTPPALMFASAASPQPVGTMGPIQYVQLTNTGAGESGGPLSMTPSLIVFGVDNDNPDDFMVASNTCSQDPDSGSEVLPPGESCTVGVRFTPQGAGTRTGTLSFRTNDPENPTSTVSMTGDAAPLGSAGSPGTNGIEGGDATTGATGTNGTNGTNGARGTNGAPGPGGAVGPTGPQGATGGPLGAYSREVSLVCSKRLKTCRVAMILRSGSRFVSASLTGKNKVEHNARSRTKAGVLLNSRGRAIRLSPGRYELRLRTAHRHARAVTRVYTLYVAV
jgi:hypothetical protein